jgi:hypothetical protein
MRFMAQTLKEKREKREVKSEAGKTKVRRSPGAGAFHLASHFSLFTFLFLAAKPPAEVCQGRLRDPGTGCTGHDNEGKRRMRRSHERAA